MSIPNVYRLSIFPFVMHLSLLPAHSGSMSLADSFLADLEDIEGVSFAPKDEMKQEPDIPMDADLPPPTFPTLLSEPSFQGFLSRIRTSPVPDFKLSRSDENFILISDCNTFTPLIEAEINALSKQIEEVYRRRFPELAQIVIDPFDYIKVVDRLGNDWSIVAADTFSDFLTSNVAVAITVTASTCTSTRLDEYAMKGVQARVSTAKDLHACKMEILNFLQIRMPLLAPNLVAVLGSPSLAAQLISAAGGVENLATMPSQNIESVGAHRRGNSVASKISLVSKCDLVESCPEETKKRAIRLVLGKTAIAARVDQFGTDDSGSTGKKLREFIQLSLEKANEPPPARAIKPLPIPADLTAPRTKRGGKRHRRMKEKYGLTEVQKKANRVQFGAEGTIDSGFLGERNVGMAGIESGGGRIRKKKSNANSSMSLTGHNGIEISTRVPSASSSSSNLFSVGFNKTR